MKKRWRKLYETHDTMVCPYCMRMVALSDTNIEHVTPRSRGGTSTPDNTIRVCKKCNSLKGALTLAEFVAWKRLEFIRNGGLSKKR